MVTITEEEYNDIKEQVNTNDKLKDTIKRIDELIKNNDYIMALEEFNK